MDAFVVQVSVAGYKPILTAELLQLLRVEGLICIQDGAEVIAADGIEYAINDACRQKNAFRRHGCLGGPTVRRSIVSMNLLPFVFSSDCVEDAVDNPNGKTLAR